MASFLILSLLRAISRCFLNVVVVQVAAVGLGGFRLFSRHRHADHLQPALLHLLALSSKVVDGLGLRQAKASRGVGRPNFVVHRVAQERDGALGLHILRSVCRELPNRNFFFPSLIVSLCRFSVMQVKSVDLFAQLDFLSLKKQLNFKALRYLRSSVEVEHQSLLLGDDAPDFLPGFVSLAVLQEAAYDAAARELSRLDLKGGGKCVKVRRSIRVLFSREQLAERCPHLQDALLPAFRQSLSRQDGETVFAHFVDLVAVVFQRNLVVGTLPADHLEGRQVSR